MSEGALAGGRCLVLIAAAPLARFALELPTTALLRFVTSSKANGRADERARAAEQGAVHQPVEIVTANAPHR
jgi:hypothetical protein